VSEKDIIREFETDRYNERAKATGRKIQTEDRYRVRETGIQREKDRQSERIQVERKRQSEKKGRQTE